MEAGEGAGWLGWGVGDEDPVRVSEAKLMVDGPPAFVDEAVVTAAEVDEVGELGLAAVGPVADVVGLHAAAAGAAGEAAAAVACLQRPAERERDLARLSADTQRFAGAFEQRDD